MRKWRESESDYVQMSWKERFGRSGVGDLIYRNKRKEIQIITCLLFTKSLPWILATMLPWIGGNQRIVHKSRFLVSSTLHHQDNSSMKWYRETHNSIVMSYRWHSQRQGSFDAFRLTWKKIVLKGEWSRKEEEEEN